MPEEHAAKEHAPKENAPGSGGRPPVWDKGLPFLLTGLVILADQAVKGLIARNWPQNSLIADVFHNGLLQIWHVRNTAIAFSLGHNIPGSLKPLLFIILPVAVLGFLLWYYFTAKDFTRLQRWAVAGVIGGGAGNLIDRIFRPSGVVDFISVKFYGLFGLERWPTFNIADSAVVVCSLLLLVTFIITPEAAAGTEHGEAARK
jgi:signal peptidase II